MQTEPTFLSIISPTNTRHEVLWKVKILQRSTMKTGFHKQCQLVMTIWFSIFKKNIIVSVLFPTLVFWIEVSSQTNVVTSISISKIQASYLERVDPHKVQCVKSPSNRRNWCSTVEWCASKWLSHHWCFQWPILSGHICRSQLLILSLHFRLLWDLKWALSRSCQR